MIYISKGKKIDGGIYQSDLMIKYELRDLVDEVTRYAQRKGKNINLKILSDGDLKEELASGRYALVFDLDSLVGSRDVAHDMKYVHNREVPRLIEFGNITNDVSCTVYDRMLKEIKSLLDK